MDLTWSYLANMGRNDLTDHLEEFYAWVMYNKLDVRSWLVITHIVKSHIRRRACTLKCMPWDPWNMFCSWRSGAPYFVSNGHCSWNGRGQAVWSAVEILHDCHIVMEPGGLCYCTLFRDTLRNFVVLVPGTPFSVQCCKIICAGYCICNNYNNLRGSSSQSHCLKIF